MVAPCCIAILNMANRRNVDVILAKAANSDILVVHPSQQELLVAWLTFLVKSKCEVSEEYKYQRWMLYLLLSSLCSSYMP